MADTTAPTTPGTSDAPKKKRGLWWKILLGLVVLLVLLVMLAPTLAGSVGRGFVLGQVNSRVAGNVEAEGLSLGWFSGTGARGVVIKDDKGNVVARFSTLQTGLSLWNALLGGGVMDLGKVVVRGEELHVVSYEDGTNNLTGAFGAKGGAAASPPAPASPTAAKPEPAPGKGLIVRADIDAQIAVITATAPNAPALKLRETAVNGKLDTGGLMQLTLKTNALNPDKSAVPITADASGTFFENGKLKALASLRGNGKVIVVDKLNLAPVTPLLKAAGVDLAVTGSFRGNAQLVEANGQQTASAQWEITDNPSVTGALLKGDTLKLQQFSGNFSAGLQGDSLENVKLVLASNVASCTISGSIKTSALGADKPLPPVAINGTVNVTEIKRQLPKLLGDIPDMTAQADLAGTLDLAKKTFTATADSMIKEIDPATGRGDSVALTKGSVVSWGDVPNNVQAQITYALERIQGIIGKKLPEKSVLAGQHTMPLHLTGALTKDAGLRALRKLSFDKTTLAFDRIYVQGADLTHGQIQLEMKDGVLTVLPTTIAANGGTLNPQGRIDFNAEPPAFIQDANAPLPLAKDIQLNKDIAAGPMAFLPLLWGNQALGKAGGAGSDASVAQVAGLVNLTMNKAYIPLDATAFKVKGTAMGSIEVRNLTTEAPFMSDLLQKLGPMAKITQPDLLAIKNGNIPPFNFSFESGKMTYQNLVLGTEKQSIKFSGSVGLDSSLSMTMEVSFHASGSGGLGGLAGLAGRSGAGGGAGQVNLAIPVGLKGTISKPEITVNQDALNKSIQNVAPGVIENLLNHGKKP